MTDVARTALLHLQAAGSSLLVKLTNLLTKHALIIAGMLDISAVTVLPVATGMAITLTLVALQGSRPAQAKFVLWPRIDQKTCLKAVVSAGLQPVVIENVLEGDELRTDVAAIEAKVTELGADNIACILTTTSCFAPRSADDIVSIAKLCNKAGIAHVINNAYGVQSAALCKLITSAWRKGRVDAVVQSTDKNFMVPVGGAVIAVGLQHSSLVDAVNKTYPGRASLSPLLDQLITLLHWGQAGWKQVLAEREDLFVYAKLQLRMLADELHERVLETPGNPVSLGLTLQHVQCPGHDEQKQSNSRNVSFLGSMLFKRCVSGVRVITRGSKQAVAGNSFLGYGSHCDAYPYDYLTVAAALGTSKQDVDHFLLKLRQSYKQCITG